jgi:hypothetical protein
MRKRSSKPGKRMDLNEIAKAIVDAATDERPDADGNPATPHAQSLTKRPATKSRSRHR